MDDDLQLVNERILSVHLGTPTAIVERYLPMLSVCLGQLKPTARQLAEFVPSIHENSLDVVASNRTYLEFARLTARDVLAGNYDGLLILEAGRVDASLVRSLLRDGTASRVNE